MDENGSKPATKEDLAMLKGEILEAMAEAMAKQRQEFLEALVKEREELLEAIDDRETRLLKAFYTWAEAAQKHSADLDRSDSSLRERMGSLEVRVTEVEKRLNMPPASQS